MFYYDPPTSDEDEDEADQGNWQTASEVDTSQPTLTMANTETGAFGWSPEE